MAHFTHALAPHGIRANTLPSLSAPVLCPAWGHDGPANARESACTCGWTGHRDTRTALHQGRLLGSIRRPPPASDLFAFKANFRNAQIEPGWLPVLAFPGGYGGMALGDHGITTLALCIRRDALRECRTRHPGLKAALAAQAHVAVTCAGVRCALSMSEREASWLSVGPIQPGMRAAWRDDGTFAISSVAGEAHPILGEGISMVIQSAWLLCERLMSRGDELRNDGPMAERTIAGDGRDDAANWRRCFASRIRLAAAFAHLAMRPASGALLLPLLQRWPGMLTAGARLGGKVRRVVDPAAAIAARLH